MHNDTNEEHRSFNCEKRREIARNILWFFTECYILIILKQEKVSPGVFNLFEQCRKSLQYGEAKMIPFMYIKGINFASPYCTKVSTDFFFLP